jgi:hypothetical protein
MPRLAPHKVDSRTTRLRVRFRQAWRECSFSGSPGTCPVPRAPLLYNAGIVIIGQGHKIGYLGDRRFRYDEADSHLRHH